MSCTPGCVHPSPSQAHCGACHVTFGGIRGFDDHRKHGVCRPPAALGYIDNGRGVWRRPISDTDRARLAVIRGVDENAPSARRGTPPAA